MKLKLKEQPVEWQKFTAVLAAFLAVILTLLRQRNRIPETAFATGIALLAAMMTASLIRPRWFRGLYRTVMTASFHVGQVVGRILLAAFFLFVLTPLGLVLRLFGKDLLRLKRPPPGESCWRPARPASPFDRLF